MTDGFTDASGAYAVGQSSLGAFTRTTASGKGVIGDYTMTETASDTYAMSESGSGTKNFTLSQTGTNSYTDIEIGNAVTGVYTRTKIGIDSYSMQEDGSKAGNPYSELVTGIDNYTLIDNGNNGTGKYTRTIDGTGNYDRTVTGLGATLHTDSGTISYRWEQTGDPHSGTFNLTQTGADRYDLLEDFHDVSNAQPGQSPGHMNIYPFGQTFVDPGSDVLASIRERHQPELSRTGESGDPIWNLLQDFLEVLGALGVPLEDLSLILQDFLEVLGALGVPLEDLSLMRQIYENAEYQLRQNQLRQQLHPRPLRPLAPLDIFHLAPLGPHHRGPRPPLDIFNLLPRPLRPSIGFTPNMLGD